jgi:uncharacterized protein YggT (Ycf19 family)
MLVLATVRDSIANFVSALIFVYSLIIIAYILMSMYLNFGGRIPYSRWSRAIMDFLRNVSEPFLSIFRRFIPPIGPIDLSPMVGLIVLGVVGSIVVNAIR